MAGTNFKTFPIIWPGDLVFTLEGLYSNSPETIKTNIKNFHEDGKGTSRIDSLQVNSGQIITERQWAFSDHNC